MITDKNAEVPVWAQCVLGFFLSIFALFVIGTISIGVYSTYKEYKERQLCISKGGVWTYACHNTGDKSFELINVYE